MRYWPISSIRNWPWLAPEIAQELDTIPAVPKLLQGVCDACVWAGDFVPAVSVQDMVLIKDACSLPKHAYLKRPPVTELEHLERFCMCENFDGEMFLIISALH